MTDVQRIADAVAAAHREAMEGCDPLGKQVADLALDWYRSEDGQRIRARVGCTPGIALMRAFAAGYAANIERLRIVESELATLAQRVSSTATEVVRQTKPQTRRE